jgi:putative transposase
MPAASFNKFTAHKFLHQLRFEGVNQLLQYIDDTSQQEYRFWQRDAKAIRMDDNTKIKYALDYIHNNPLQEHWKLADRPENYRWSSSEFYKTGIDEFGILSKIDKYP